MKTSLFSFIISIRNSVFSQFFNFKLLPIFVLLVQLPQVALAGDQYWGGSGNWESTGTGWSVVGSTSAPYSSAWTGTSSVSTIAYFNIPNSTVTGPTSQIVNVGGIEALENVTITKAASNSKTIACVGANTLTSTLIPINVASGKVFDLGIQQITPANLNGITKNGNGELALAGSLYLGGFTLNAGQVTMKAASALGSSSLTINGGTIATITNYILSNTVNINNSITIGGDFTLGAASSLAPVGTGTSGMSAFNITFPTYPTSLGAATRTITLGGTGTYTFNGVISGNSGVGLTLAGNANGTLKLTAANTYDGGTTISGGTLLLGAGEVLANTGTVTLNGGTLKTTTTFSETMGTLALTDNSTIALTNGINTLTFADSHSIAWTSGKIVTITGWAGTAGTSGTAGKIFVGTDANSLTSTQLEQIIFTGYNSGAQLLSTGEVVPTTSVRVSTSINASTLTNCGVCDIKVITGGTLIIDAAKTVNSVTVEAGGKLNLASPLVVTDVVLKADESGSFSANIEAVSTVSGTVRYDRTMLDTKWYFMSFPCNVNVNDISGGGTIDVDWVIQEYNGSHRATVGAGGNWSHITSGTLTAKKGYIFGLKTGGGTKTLSFILDKSLIQNEVVTTVPATFYSGSVGTNHNGWNLVGQPYLSKFSGANVGLNFLTIWTGSAYDGKANTAVASINPFEAFFVQVADNNPISFAWAGRQTVRSSVDVDLSDRVQLLFTTSTGSDKTNLIMDANQSTMYEINKDLEKWITTQTDKPQVYTRLDGVNYAYNALPMTDVVNVPVGFYTKNAGSASISVNASQAPSLSKLLLADNTTNPATVTDLLKSDYTFDATAGTDNNRFVITAQRVATENTFPNSFVDEPELRVNNSQLIIRNLEGRSIVRVYDAIGRMVVNKSVSSNTIEIPFSEKGIYTIQIESRVNNWTKKIANQ